MEVKSSERALSPSGGQQSVSLALLCWDKKGERYEDEVDKTFGDSAPAKCGLLSECKWL